MTKSAEKRRMAEILRILDRHYPEAECSLTHADPFQLLVATILSAQCTDERVNLVTPEVFRRYPTPAALARADMVELQKVIQSTGFFRNKALALKEASRAIMERHGGKVPETLEELVKLRGVGRKTANVILGNCFGVPCVVVDTHVGRLSLRMGFTTSKDPVRVEQELMLVAPKDRWILMAHLFIYHGRAICTARRALCDECPVAHLCPKIGVG